MSDTKTTRKPGQKEIERRKQLAKEREEYFRQRYAEIVSTEGYAGVEPKDNLEKEENIEATKDLGTSQMEKYDDDVPIEKLQERKGILRREEKKEEKSEEPDKKVRFKTIPARVYRDEDTEDSDFDEEETIQRPKKKRKSGDSNNDAKSSAFAPIRDYFIQNAMYMGGVILLIALKAAGFKMLEYRQNEARKESASSYRPPNIPNVSNFPKPDTAKPPPKPMTSISHDSFYK